ncbi:MAG: glycosyltransferase family 2 protein [Syntrophotaleaceae bacterium]
MNTLLSFIIPVKDEEDSLAELADRIVQTVLTSCPDHGFELVFVDDGSTDRSWAVIRTISQSYPGCVQAFRFRRNLGKALALQAGFQCCRGDIVFTMDADLQDDPKEIPRFMAKLNDGYDLVSGWKKTRNDPLSKTLPSRLFNSVTAKVTGVRLKDFNCGFKCYRREVVENLFLYGELHRYIPVLAADLGYRVGEISVEHHPRLYGRSKYGWERYARGFIDLVTVMATTRWVNKPGHLFGGAGLVLGVVGGVSLSYLLVLWLLGERPIGSRPLLTFGVLTTIASLQMISLGIVTEFFIKQQGRDCLEKYVSEQLSSDQDEAA